MKKSAQIEKVSFGVCSCSSGFRFPNRGMDRMYHSGILKLNPVKSMLCALAGNYPCGGSLYSVG